MLNSAERENGSVNKYENVEGRGFQHLPRDLTNVNALKNHVWSLLASVANLDAPSDWRPGGREFNPSRGRQNAFVEIDHELFSTVILSLPLIQEGQLSNSGKRMCIILVNRSEDLACLVNVWLGKLTALDMTSMGWLGR